MKIRICALLFALLFCFVSRGLWFTYRGGLAFNTDLKDNTTVTLQYRKKVSSNINELVAETQSDGRVSFTLKGRTLTWFKLDMPEHSTIQKAYFSGQEKGNISLSNQNEYNGEVLHNRIIITSWYNLILLFCIGYYLSRFLLYSLKKGFPKDSNRLPQMLNLEFLRIVFMVCIVLHHISQEAHFFSYGQFGVEFFFILSGFLFALTYNNTTGFKDFVQRKIIRFLPLIVLCGIVHALVAKQVDFSKLSVDWFLGTTLLFTRNSYVAPAWYIAILFWVTSLYFYMLKTQRKETVYTIIAILTFFAYVACVRFGWGLFPGLGSEDNLGYLIPQSLMRGVGGIGLGFFVGVFYLNRDQKKNLFKTWQYTLAEICFLILPCVSMFYKPMAPNSLMVLVVAYVGLLYLFAVKKGYISRFFEKPVFNKVSRYTLAIYLSHQTIAFPLLIWYGVKFPFPESMGLGIFIYGITSCVVGVIVHHAVELPATNFLKKWLS